jgi:hypothetical protein
MNGVAGTPFKRPTSFLLLSSTRARPDFVGTQTRRQHPYFLRDYGAFCLTG